jgi:hypothetical protein
VLRGLLPLLPALLRSLTDRVVQPIALRRLALRAGIGLIAALLLMTAAGFLIAALYQTLLIALHPAGAAAMVALLLLILALCLLLWLNRWRPRPPVQRQPEPLADPLEPLTRATAAAPLKTVLVALLAGVVAGLLDRRR